MSLQYVNESNFESIVLKSEYPVLLDFYADWCGPCKMMMPVLEQMATELEGKAVIAKVNVDESPRLAQQFHVMNVPTFISFKNGDMQSKNIGALPKPALLNMLGL